MLEAIIKYPRATDIQSRYWEETIKPDLDLQYETFVSTCSARGRGAKSYWETKGKDKDNLSIPQVILKDNSLKDKDKDKDKNKDNIYSSEFEDFWKSYPKQRAGSKDKAYSSYCRVIKEKRSTVEKLLDSVKKYANSTEVKRGFAKGCAAWLNDDRFNNSYEVEKDDFSIDWEAEGFVFPKGRGAK